MPRRKKEKVHDILTWSDAGEMFLSFFAVIGVLSSPTIVPQAFKDAGLWLILISVIIIYISIYMIILIKGHEKDAAIQASYHLISAIIITSASTLIAGIIYGFILDHTLQEIIESPLTVAFSVGLLWSGIIDGLKN